MDTADKDTEKKVLPEWAEGSSDYSIIADEEKAQEALENWQGNTEDYFDEDEEYHYRSGVDAWVKKSDVGHLIVILLVMSLFITLGAFWLGVHKGDLLNMGSTVTALKNNSGTVLSYVGSPKGFEVQGTLNSVKTDIDGAEYKVDIKNIMYTDIESLFEHDGNKNSQVLYKCQLGDEEWYLLFVYKKQS